MDDAQIMRVVPEPTKGSYTRSPGRELQFDIERGKAATLVIVPETREPRVVAIQIPELRETALALALIGRRLNEQEPE